MKHPTARPAVHRNADSELDRTTAAANLVAGIDSGEPRAQLRLLLMRASKGYALVPSAR